MVCDSKRQLRRGDGRPANSMRWAGDVERRADLNAKPTVAELFPVGEDSHSVTSSLPPDDGDATE